MRGEDSHVLKIWIKPVSVSTHRKDEAFIPIILNLKKDPALNSEEHSEKESD